MASSGRRRRIASRCGLFSEVHARHLRRWPLAFWRYAVAVIIAGLWGLACLCVGHRLLRRILRSPLRYADELALAFPLGLTIFGLGIFVLGLLGALGAFTFFAWPAALLATGRPLLRSVSRLVRHARYRRFHRRMPALWLGGMAAATLGFLFIYYPLLSPEMIMFDARWYHLAMAERYAADGAIRQFAEGWWLGAFPQLATYLYTWAFLLPMSTLFDRVELSAHIELVAVLFTLAGIPSLVRLLLGGIRAPLSFLAFFLFPGIYLYDSNLCVGADHVAAVFAVPVAFSLIRFAPTFDARWGTLLGLYLASAFITKYSAVIVGVFPAVAVAVRSAWLLASGVRTRDFRWLRGFGALVLSGVGLSSIHWLKNSVFYSDPFYPELRKLVPSRPWVPEAEAMHEALISMRFAPRPGMDGILDGLRTMLTFSFVPNDWDVFHRDWPTFGSLFTLTLPFVLMCRFCSPPVFRARRRD